MPELPFFFFIAAGLRGIEPLRPGQDWSGPIKEGGREGCSTIGG